MNRSYRKASRGYTLIEVLIGILIFAVGMMALAQLQTQLTRNSTDANARTVGMNIAEELIERVSTFGRIEGGTAAMPAYDDITAANLGREITREGNTYTVVADVQDFYYDHDNKNFVALDTPPAGVAKSDFKRVNLTVSWDSLADEGLGSGSVSVSKVISSITSASGGKVALNATGSSSYAPEVDYNPGQNPDIVSIDLGNYKFKESTTPLPDVLRADELVETAFDVVTYSNPNNGTDATYLRREEFRAVSCECTLRIPTGNEGGLRPTVWNGEEYEEGAFVSKPYGQSASNQQSNLCNLCCRDHHDGGYSEYDVEGDPGLSKYDPFRAPGDYHTTGSLAGNHKHYNRGANGQLVLADQDGARYVEACRMVRKDGFFRVAQDLRQEGLNAFPANFLDQEAEVQHYSNYVTGAVGIFKGDALYLDDYELQDVRLTKPGDMATPVVFPASSFANASQMSEANGVTSQQLRSRGIYLDYMSEELRGKIVCLDALGDGQGGELCDLDRVSSALEIIPFYDVQLTWLSRWNETPSNNPIDVTNEAIADDNAHSRGVASLQAGTGYSTINALVHRGNLGLTGTDPIDGNYMADERRYNLYARAVDPSDPPQMSSIRVFGSILSSVPGLKAADVEIEASGAACDRTNTGFECVLEVDPKQPPVLKVFNYDKADKLIYACSNELELDPPREHISLNGSGSWTNFSMDVLVNTTTDIVIKEGGC